jgi:hypothetical protein
VDPSKKIVAAEVVGSTPTRSISFILANYCIVLNSFLMNVGQIKQQTTTMLALDLRLQIRLGK